MDQDNGVDVYFDDATTAGDFREEKIATLSRTSAHSIRFMLNFKNGPSNDDVKIFIDGKKTISGTTWEDYYHAENQDVAPVSKMLFRAAGTAAATSGNGFLIDNLTLSS